MKSVADTTHVEARGYYESQRRDPAATSRYSPPAPGEPSTDPVCPHCGQSLGKRKPPSRRSTFKCKKCQSHVHADPQQKLFASVYLTPEQASLVDHLWQLDRWIFTAGTWRDFCWAKEQIGKGDQPNSTELVADTIWFLLNYNREHIAEIVGTSDAFVLKTYREDIAALIKQFRSERKAYTASGRKLR